MSIAEAYALAVQHHGSGNLQLAEQIYRQILQADPLHLDSMHQLGIIAYQVGRLNLAHTYVSDVLRSQPAFAEALNTMGIILRAQGKLEEAVACWRQSLDLKPYHPHAHSNMGLTLNELGRLDEAVASLRQALLLNPDFPEARNNLGNALRKLSQLDEAATSLREAVRLRPDYAEAHNNLGLVLAQQRLTDEAVSCFQQALRLKPDYADAQNNLGSVLGKEGRYDEAIACFQQALANNPRDAEACNNLGFACFLTGRRREAEEHYDRTLEIDPNHAGAHLNRAILWLQRGDYVHGWPEYEWRWRHKDSLPRAFSQPGWQGEPLPGKTILLHAEQGLGDTLQFVRYASLVKERSGATVLLECQRELVHLLSRCPGIDSVLSQVESLPSFDVHAALLSLPYLLGTRSLTDIPVKIPYLEVAPVLVEHWRVRLTSVPGFRVGIVWQGNPENKRDRWRSVPLEKFAPLAGINGVSLISLQMGTGREELRTRPEIALDVEVELTEPGAIMKNLDLVISVDTAPAHLAGALGVPTWVLLPHVADWRWLLERTGSPWYATMRLFRQARPNDWDDVFDRIKSALEERLCSR